MRLREVLREAWRDISTGASWAFTWALVLGLLLAGLVGVRAAELVADVRAATDYVASGAATTVQEARGRIDGRTCDAIADSEGVVAAGALRRLEDGTVPAALPGSALPTYEVTPGLLAVLGEPQLTGHPGVVLSPTVRESLGLAAARGTALELADGGSVPVAGAYAYPDDGRDPDLEYAVLAPSVDDARPYDACWVTVWPQRDDTVSLLRRSVLTSTGAEDEDRPTVGQLNPRLGAAFTPSGGTGQATLLAAAGAVGVLVGGAAVVRRRLVLASDLHIGTPRCAQVLGVVLQHVIWALTSALASTAVAVVIVRMLPPEDAWPILHAAGGIAAVGSAAGVLGGAAAAGCVRERALHRYFRTR
ncbi:hypothetical protein [Curtobacterium sp. NPDC089689]|uniref:hypothetical protein n=1 Tax=Curtobacterium sp. NPDC089689 TaxID=3363968 RepID=UPI00381E1018